MIRFTDPLQKAYAPKFPSLSDEERALRDALLAATRRIRDRIVAAQIERALEHYDVEGAIHLAQIKLGEDYLASVIPANLRRAYERMGAATTRDVEQRFGIEYTFNQISPGAIDWVQRTAGSLIEQWGHSTREALRQLIARGFQEAIPYGKLARMIRDTGIGLTKQHERWVDRFRARLEAEGFPASKIDARVERYYRQLLKLRAEMIARTEIARASENARLESWKQAINRGLLDTRRMEKEWLATSDRRVCERCSDLDGTRAPAPDGIFVSEGGEDGGLGPPAHPACRCASILVPKGSRKMPRARVNIPGDRGIRPGIRKYSPDQPRVPAGSPEGGEWEGGQGGGRGGEFEHERVNRPKVPFNSLQGQKDHRADLLYELKRYRVAQRSPDYTDAQKDGFDAKIREIEEELKFTESEIARLGGR